MMAKELAWDITNRIREQDIVAICDPADSTVIVWGQGLLLFLRCRDSGRLRKAEYAELNRWQETMHHHNAQAMVITAKDVAKVLRHIAAHVER